jgi:hypothetical protein
VKTKQFKNLPSFKAPSKINNVTKAIAITSLAMGVAAIIPAAPARAVLLSTGQLAFSDGTSDFYAAGSPSSYNVNFDPFGLVFVNSATDAFSSAFTPGTTSTVNRNSPATFNFVSGSTYSLASDLNFSFTNGVTVSLDRGSTFTQTFNVANNTNGLALSNQSVTGKVTNTDGTVSLQALSFSVNDNQNPGGGSYSITLSPTSGATAVPEPFTVIGTLVGGAAALRMKKKLADATKN